jgi:SAM-dependent methyltransferase
MSQITTGVRSILSSPSIYNLSQLVMGANSSRKSFADSHLQIEPNGNFLDIGCGTAEIRAFLPADINYFGFDQDQSYIDHARTKFGDAGQFERATVNALTIAGLPRMDVVLAIGLIHHLDDSEVITLMQIAKEVLSEHGRFVTLDPCYDSGQNRIAKWLIDRDRGNHVRDQSSYLRLAEQVFTRVQSTVNHKAWVPYTHNILVCER